MTAKSLSRLNTSTILTSALAAVVAAQPVWADGITGGSAVIGSASIAQSGTHTEITTATSNTLMEFRTFNVNTGESANVAQPGSSSKFMARVVGGLGASNIDGTLTSNGNVFIVNSQGVLFGAGANVNVGGLVASTADISNDNFTKGDLKFDRAGSPSAFVENRGNINIADGGLSLFVAPTVKNTGYVKAKLGKVQMAAGDTFTMDMYGDGLLSVQASDAVNKQLVQNSGAIDAAGGTVVLTAAAAQEAVESVINMDGLIEASSISKQGGKVVLSGAKTTLVSGTIKAKGATKGGNVDVLGDNVGILSGASIDASGKTGGGKIRVGGDFHGAGDVANSKNVVVQSDAKLLANATENGNGGDVAVWADNNAFFYGDIEAKGGALGGNGGFVETSGKAYLDAYGNVDASAANGSGGQWLLDPNNITITDSPNTDANVTGNPDFTTNANSGRVSVASIQGNLNAGTSVTITTGTGGTNTQDGDITVAKDITKSAGTDASLTLNAHNDIIFNGNANLKSTSGKLNVTLNADKDATGGGAVMMSSNSSIETNGGDIVIGGGSSPLTTAAIGHTGQVDGVDLDGALLDAAGGNISIRGQGLVDTSSDRRGVRIRGGAVVQTNGNGTITIIGQGGGGGAGDDNYGVQLLGSGSSVTAVNGAIVINGTGGGSNISTSKNNNGIVMNNGTTISSTGSGAITLTGISGGDHLSANGNDGMHIYGGTNTIGGASATGDITVATDTLDVANTLVIRTSNNVTLKPTTNSTGIGIAGGAGTLQLTNAILNSINAGHITIGSNSVSGALTANAYTWGADASLLTGSGNIAINGVQTMGGHTLLANTASGDITIGASGGATSNASGDAIILAASGGDFINNNTGTPLTANGGRWLVYSTDPANNTLNGITSDFFRYSCTYGGSCPSFPSSGNGLLYSITPVITVTLIPDATSTTYGEAAPTFTYTFSGYNAGDEASDSRTGSAVLSTTYNIGDDVGFYDIIADKGTLTSSLGYAFQGSTLTNGLTVNKRSLTLTADSLSAVYADNYAASLTGSSSGLYSGDVAGTSLAYNVSTTGSDFSTGNHLKVGGYNITATIIADPASTFKSSNYNITNNDGTLNITKRDLAITSASVDNKVYDGTTATTSPTLWTDNRASGDTGLSYGFTDATFDNKNVADGKTVTFNNVTVTGADAGNYNFDTNVTTLANITKKDLTVTADDASFVYGTDIADMTTSGAFGAAVTGLASGDNISNYALGVGDFAIDGSDLSTGGYLKAGNGYKTYAAAGSGANFDPNNYNITSVNGTLTITKRDLTVSATAQDKTYDANRNATVTLSNDALSGDVVTNSKTGALFDTKDAGIDKIVTVSGIAINGADAGNYTLASTTATDLADINKAALTIKARNQTTIYSLLGNTLFMGYTTSGLKGGETVGSVTLSTNAQSSTSGNWKATNGTPWTITPSNATGGTFNINNYNVAYQTGTLTINRLPILVTVDAQNKTYDATTTATVSFGDNRVSGDVFNTTYTSANFNNKNVGNNKLVTVNGIAISGTDASNYNLLNTTGIDLANITKAALSITARDVSMTYGDDNNFDGYDAVGLQGGETIGNVNLSTNATESTSLNWNVSDPINPWVITASGASGGSFSTSNYNITYVAGSLVISPKDLTVAATAQDKTYDGTRDATVTLSSVDQLGGDIIDYDYSTARFGNKNAGTGKNVTVKGITISGTDAANYNLLNTTATDTADIFKRLLTLTLTADDKIYDGNRVANVSAIDDDRVSGDSLSVDYNRARFDDRHVGTDKTVTVFGLDIHGADRNNYYLVSPTQTTLADITPKALTITANDVNMVFGDGNNFAGVSTSGLVTGEDIGTIDLTTNDGTSVGGHWNAGTWSITPDNVGNNGRFRATNYDITYVDGTLIVTPKTLTVTADAQTKVYGDADPTFTYGSSGFASGEDASIFTGALSRTAGENVAGGPYAINQGSLDAGGNYSISYTGNSMSITPANLFVVADDQTMSMGGSIPFLTWLSSGFKFADNDGNVLTGGLETVGGRPLGGSYPITIGTLAANSNYTLIFTGGTLFVDSPFGSGAGTDGDNTSEQTSDFNSANFKNSPKTTLLSSGGGGGGNPGGNLGNLAPAAGGDPSQLGDLNPAAGGDQFSMMDCDANTPCDTPQ